LKIQSWPYAGQDKSTSVAATVRFNSKYILNKAISKYLVFGISICYAKMIDTFREFH